MKNKKINHEYKRSSYFFKKGDNLWNEQIGKKIHYSHLVTEKIIDFVKNNKIKSIAIYLSGQDQISTIGIIKWCFENQVDIFIYNFDASYNDFVFYPITSFDYEIVDVKSYRNIIPKHFNEFKQQKIDLLIIPIYFLDKDNVVYYYEMKNYSSVIKFNHQYLIGIGYENISKTHKFWNALLKNKKIYKVICDEIFLANELELLKTIKK